MGPICARDLVAVQIYLRRLAATLWMARVTARCLARVTASAAAA